MKIKISVITSIYKGTSYLESYLLNCLEQDNFEIIEFIIEISEPCLEDLEIIKKFQPQFGQQLKVFTSKRRIGIYQSWNHAISESRGEFIAIWNVDDKRTKNSLSSQFELARNENCAAVFGPYKVVRNYGSIDGSWVSNANSNHQDNFQSMLLGPFYMFSKKSLKILRGFDEQFRVASDFDFAIRLASLGKFESTTNLIGYYLDSNEGVSTRKDGVQAQEREAIYARYGAFHKSDPTLLHNIRKFDLDRVFVHDRIYTLRECTSNLDYIFEKNHSEESLSQWVTRWKTINNNNRANTLMFYIKKRKMRKIAKFFLHYFRKGSRRP